jgi:integrase
MTADDPSIFENLSPYLLIKMSDKIDIHNIEKRFEDSVRRIEIDEDIIKRNRELMLQFISDCRLGKTLKGRSKKKIGKSRILKYIYTLKHLSIWFAKPFDEVNQTDMENLISNLEEDKYLYKNKPYGEETKLDYKKTIKKFYKWLRLENLTEFIVPAITREEAEKLINSTPETLLKAAIMVLFDGGARAGELLNREIDLSFFVLIVAHDMRTNGRILWF